MYSAHDIKALDLAQQSYRAKAQETRLRKETPYLLENLKCHIFPPVLPPAGAYLSPPSRLRPAHVEMIFHYKERNAFGTSGVSFSAARDTTMREVLARMVGMVRKIFWMKGKSAMQVTISATLHYAELGNKVDDEGLGLTVGKFITAAKTRQLLQSRDTQGNSRTLSLILESAPI